MNVRTLLTAVVGCGCILAGAPAVPHHSFLSEYDRNLTVTITGTVTLLEWTNPHARLYVDAPDENGEIVHWNLELGPPNGLMRLGWRRDSLQPGTEVTVTGFRSRTEDNVANARTVTLSDGREVFAGSSFDTTTPP
ncbi:DUF6152 family protein [Candidatus Rariloculus sp.]|uniref:DUF6152 family protein n=1 Tax=Candidatus Rariloculus sp. TaxID=3101265 RepID=UPI003D10C999